MARGSVRDRGDGKWQLEVDLGYSVDPKTNKRKRKKKYKTITAKGKREAEKELTKFVAEVTGENYFEAEKIMFVDFVQKHWIPKYAEKHLAPRTYETYILHLRNRILPAFQALQLDQVQPLHIISFLDNLSESGIRKDGKDGGLSPGTIEYNHRIIKNIFNRAVEWKLIKESPAADVKKPKVTQKEIKIYDEDQVFKLMDALSGAPLHWQLFIKLAVTTGMSRSELLGLEWKHFDLEECTISVRQGLTYTKKHGYVVGDTKNKNRKRKVSFPSTLISDFKKYKLQKNSERVSIEDALLWEKGKYFLVFSNETGKPFHPSSVKNWWTRFIERHKLDYINFHALRHTSATLLISQGVHAKIISSRLGHADIKTTMNIYGHAMEKADVEAAKHFDTFLENKNDRTN